MITDVYLRANSPEIRQKIKDAGISVCICSGFDGSDILHCCRSIIQEIKDGKKLFYVHGIGYTDDDEPKGRHEYYIKEFLDDVENKDSAVDCGSDVDMFISEIKKMHNDVYKLED